MSNNQQRMNQQQNQMMQQRNQMMQHQHQTMNQMQNMMNQHPNQMHFQPNHMSHQQHHQQQYFNQNVQFRPQQQNQFMQSYQQQPQQMMYQQQQQHGVNSFQPQMNHQPQQKKMNNMMYQPNNTTKIKTNMKPQSQCFVQDFNKLSYKWKKNKYFKLDDMQELCIGNTKELEIGFDWDVQLLTMEVDGSCVCFMDNGRHGCSIWWNNLSGNGIHHVKGVDSIDYGRGSEFGGSKEKEVMYLNLEKVPKNTTSIFVTLHMYAIGTFASVADLKIRIRALHRNSPGDIDFGKSYKKTIKKHYTKSNICKIKKISKSKRFANKTGLVYCVIYRHPNNPGVWFIRSIGEPLKGREISDNCYKQLQPFIPLQAFGKTKIPDQSVMEKIKKIHIERENVANPKVGVKPCVRFRARAKGLPKMDTFGKSDPFYEIYAGKQKIVRSSIILKTLTPTWKDVVDIPAYPGTMTCKLYDFDVVGSNDFMGEFKFTFEELMKGKVVFNFKGKKRSKCSFEFIPVNGGQVGYHGGNYQEKVLQARNNIRLIINRNDKFESKKFVFLDFYNAKAMKKGSGSAKASKFFKGIGNMVKKELKNLT